MYICLVSKSVVYTPEAATVKSHEGSVFEAWIASDILFSSLYWIPLMQTISAKSVKILAARQKSFFWFCLMSRCCNNSKGHVPAPGPCLERIVCHGVSLIRLCKELCWIWCRDAPVVGWLLQWFPLWSSSLFPLGLSKKIGFSSKPLSPSNPSLVSHITFKLLVLAWNTFCNSPDCNFKCVLYLFTVMSQWLHAWFERGWPLLPVPNLFIVERLLKSYSQRHCSPLLPPPKKACFYCHEAQVYSMISLKQIETTTKHSLRQTQQVTFWGEGCGSHTPLVHNHHVNCSHCSSTSKIRLQILHPLDCLFTVPTAEHGVGPA